MAGQDQVAYFASKLGWTIGEVTLVVEGELDVAYCGVANDLYKAKENLTLLSPRFAITACGKGPQGGTDGLMERFPFMHRIAAFESEAGNSKYRFVALFDNDPPGQSSYNVIRHANKNLIECFDIFLLQRRFPSYISDPVTLKATIATENASWTGLSCEVEDLVEWSLLDGFVTANAGCLMKPPQQSNGEWHFDFRRQFKPPLFRYVAAKATLSSLDRIIATLKAFREYCGLPPGGDPAPKQ